MSTADSSSGTTPNPARRGGPLARSLLAEPFQAATRDRLNEIKQRAQVDGTERCGTGILCNTSLNHKGNGFLNRMSDLLAYCEARGVADIVVGDTWYGRR